MPSPQAGSLREADPPGGRNLAVDAFAPEDGARRAHRNPS